MSRFAIYKRGQGKYTRVITLVSIMVVGVAGAYVLSEKLYGYTATATPYLRFGIPTLVVFLLGLLMLWLVNRPKSADFLIATEGEMKKVSWSSKTEVIGSTKVVIITAFMLASILFGIDLLFTFLFRWMEIIPKGSAAV